MGEKKVPKKLRENDVDYAFANYRMWIYIAFTKYGSKGFNVNPS
jgi:hypothetical protein